MKEIRAHFTDDVLVQMYKDGDSTAFGFIIERYSPVIGHYVFAIMKDLILAEDILQDTFIKAMKSIRAGGYKEEGTFKSWLLRIAHNLCIDYTRKSKKMPFAFSISTSGDFEEKGKIFYFPMPTYEKNAEEKIIKRETEYDIYELINCLPYEQKEVVILRIFHDFSFKEIAEYTDVSINTALGRMRYALINIRKQINELKRNGKNILRSMRI